MGEPASGTWPPFAPGHELSMRHGAQSERRLRPIAEALEAELLEVASWCGRPAFAPSVRGWAWAEAAAELYRCHFDELGLFDDEGEPRPGLERWARAEAHAAAMRARLALDPGSYVKLLSLVTSTSSGDPDERAALLAEARSLVEARPALEVVDDEDQDDDEEDER